MDSSKKMDSGITITGNIVMILGIIAAMGGYITLLLPMPIPQIILGSDVFNPTPSDIIIAGLLFAGAGACINTLLTDKTPIRDH